MMDHRQHLMLLCLLCATSAAPLIGPNCLHCYSGVCSSNSSQLTQLLTNTLDCCSCFGIGNSNCTSNDSSTVEMVKGVYSNTSLEDCCTNVSRIVTNESYKLVKQNDVRSCNSSESIFHDQGLLLNDMVSVRNETGMGTYIVTHFIFMCNGCVGSLLFSVTNRSNISLDSNMLQFTIYRKYDNRGSSTSKLYEAKSHFNVSMESTNTPNWVIATPLSTACFEWGDVLGFTISSGSSFQIVGNVGVSDTNIFNITDYSSKTDCQQLDGLIERVGSIPTAFDPLMVVKIAPTSTLVPTATSSLSLVPLPTSVSAEPTLNTTTQHTSTDKALQLSLPIIIAIGASGCVTVILMFLVLVLAIYCIRKRFRKTAVVNRHAKNGRIGRVVSTMRSQRMDDLLSPQVITVINKDLEDDDLHDYDIPAELRNSDLTQQVHFYHELENKQEKNFNPMFAESYKYMTMNSPMEQSPESHQGRAAATGQHMPDILEAYHDPIELKDIDVGSHIALNPLYRTGMEANDDKSSYDPTCHYDVPTALMRAHENTPPPIYHILEESTHKTKTKRGVPDANIYTETGFNIRDDTPSHGSTFGSQYSFQSGSVDTTIDPLSPSVRSDSALLPHVYHELENTSTVAPTINIDEIQVSGRHTPLRQDCELEGSLGRHRVFEPGIYVPGGDERQHLAVVTQVDKSDVYQSWKQKSSKAGTKKKEFFEDSAQFWEPKNAEQDIYNQLSDKKFREILRDQIEFSSHLGVGQFGSVSKATWSNMLGGFKKVAVKTLKPTNKLDAKVAFLKEAAIMGQFCHSNVVQLYGVVTVGEPIMIVMELMALGDLDTYLWKNYRPGEMSPPHKNTLLSFSRQVACGMKYLERKKFVHRDLAARNVLVTETLVCKIGDFGMSCFLKDTNYYASRGGTVPIKWTAPEGLNYKKFSTASDVYSYGMILYEIWSLGLKPLTHVKIQNVSQFVTEGHCQHPPPGCPRRIYEIMVQCWIPDQKYRPTFAGIFEILSGSDSNLLKWFDNDRATSSNLAMQLGSPLKEAKDMFLDLQRRNIVKEEFLPYTGNLRTEV